VKSASRDVLVIGSGISGISSALELANSGLTVHLVEREVVVGGHSASFCCKATDVCVRCSACVIPDKVREAVLHPGIRLHTNSTVRKLAGKSGDFRVEIVHQPGPVDPERCIACGLCTGICPVDPRAIHAPRAEAAPFAYVLDEGLCLRFKGEKCVLCREGCPTGAIDYERKSKAVDLSIGAIIVATGFDVVDARGKGSLGYGRYPNVITGLDLEQLFAREGRLSLPGNGREPRSVAFVQCVGSRDERHGYCSHVCCKYAMKFGGLIKYQRPDTQVTIFYIDLQTAGKGFAGFYEEYKESIRFVRGVPVEIVEAASGELEVKFEDISQAKVRRDRFDMVILSVGIAPRKDAWDLAKVLGINMADDGFFALADSSAANEASVKGIFLAGTCQGPRDIPDAVSHGMSAASGVLGMLDGVAARPAGD
jgi:heterodisulfide reductase subunit A2